MKSDCLSSVPGAAIRNCGQAPQKANVLSPTHSPHPTPRAPRGWRSSHATRQSSREALPRVAAYWGRGSCYLGAPGWGGSRHGPGISTDAEPSSWSQSPPGPRRTRTPTSAPIPSHPVMVPAPRAGRTPARSEEEARGGSPNFCGRSGRNGLPLADAWSPTLTVCLPRQRASSSGARRRCVRWRTN